MKQIRDKEMERELAEAEGESLEAENNAKPGVDVPLSNMNPESLRQRANNTANPVGAIAVNVDAKDPD